MNHLRGISCLRNYYVYLYLVCTPLRDDISLHFLLSLCYRMVIMITICCYMAVLLCIIHQCMPFSWWPAVSFIRKCLQGNEAKELHALAYRLRRPIYICILHSKNYFITHGMSYNPWYYVTIKTILLLP